MHVSQAALLPGKCFASLALLSLHAPNGKQSYKRVAIKRRFLCNVREYIISWKKEYFAGASKLQTPLQR